MVLIAPPSLFQRELEEQTVLKKWLGHTTVEGLFNDRTREFCY